MRRMTVCDDLTRCGPANPRAGVNELKPLRDVRVAAVDRGRPPDRGRERAECSRRADRENPRVNRTIGGGRLGESGSKWRFRNLPLRADNRFAIRIVCIPSARVARRRASLPLHPQKLL